MSDTSQGPGWWQASDGKWYAPELYPKDWPKPNPAATDEAAEAVGAATTDATDAAAAAAQTFAEPAVEAAETVAPSFPEPAPEAVPPIVPEPAVETVAPSFPEPAPEAMPPIVPEPAVEAAAPAFPEVAPEVPPIGDPAAEWGDVPSADTGTAYDTPQTDPAPDAWGGPDPAAGEPTAVFEVPQLTQDPTASQPAVEAPVATSPDTWAAGAVPPDQAPAATTVAPVETSGDIPAALISLIGGALAVVGSFLAWAVAGGTLTDGDVNGLSGSNGWGTLVCGLVAASGAALLFAGLRRWWVGAGIAVAALVGLGLVIFSIFDIGSTSDDLPAILREAGLDETNAAGAKLDLDLGIWIVVAGCAIALIGGLVAFSRRQD